MSKKEKLLLLLKDLQWHGSKELAKDIGHRFGAQIYILRRLGYKIEIRRSEKGGASYMLKNLESSEPQRRRVQVYLEQEDVFDLVVNKIPTVALLEAVMKAYDRHRAELGII